MKNTKVNKNLKNILVNYVYDGNTLQQAIEFCERCYNQNPNEMTISAAKNDIIDSGRKDLINLIS